MSTKINLLPWREELKKERQKEFYVVLGIAAVLGVGVWMGGRTYITDLTSQQESRNGMLRTEIRSLDRQIERIKDLETVRDRLNARMEVIQDLQRGRPQVVHLFEELVLTVPEGLFLNSLQQASDSLTVTGVGQSNARVSGYMEQLDASPWLRDPDLTVIEVERRDGVRVSNFTLQVKQATPGGGNGEDSR